MKPIPRILENRWLKLMGWMIFFTITSFMISRSFSFDDRYRLSFERLGSIKVFNRLSAIGNSSEPNRIGLVQDSSRESMNFYHLNKANETIFAKLDRDNDQKDEEWYSKPEKPSPLTIFQYAKVINPGAPIYLSLGDAVNRSNTFNRSQMSALVYMSYSDFAVIDGIRYYRVGADQWMTEEDLIPEAYSDFSGIVIKDSDVSGFGWVLEDRYSIMIDEQTGMEKAGQWYYRYQVLPVTKVIEKNGTFFYEIAPEEWLPDESFSAVRTNMAPPAKAKNCRWIEVSISQQNLVLYDRCKIVFATLISSGKHPGWTAPGLYTISRKEEYLTLTDLNPSDTDSYYLQDVPWVMFYAGAWAIHSAYWHDNFGFPYSHGCITLSPTDARFVYSWVKWGDVLRIID